MIAAVLLVLVYRLILRCAFRRLQDRSLALLLERRFPELNDALVTAVDTTVTDREGGRGDMRQAMLARATELAAERVGNLKTRDVLRFGPLVRNLTGAAAMLLSIAAFALLAQQAFATWNARLLLLSDAPWPRRAQIEVLDFVERQRKVAEGSDLSVRVRAAANRPTPPPSVCTIAYQTEGGQRGRVNMSRDGEPRDGFQYYRYEGQPFQGMLDNVAFDVIGLDHRVSDYQVKVVPSPSIFEVVLDCELPAYMDQPERRERWRPGTSLPAGTQVKLTVRSTKPLQEVLIQQDETSEAETLTFPPDPATTEFRINLTRLRETKTVQLELLDQDGVRSEQPYRVTINILEDLPPQVDVRLDGIGTAITPQARLPVKGEVKDDYRVKESWFQIDVPEKSESFRKSLVRMPSGRVDDALDLCAERLETKDAWQFTPGDKVVFSVRATDYYDLDEPMNLGQTDELPLDVVTPDELLALLEARELNLKRRFEQTVAELIETRDSLLRLLAMLDPPADETRDEPGAETEPAPSEATAEAGELDELEDSSRANERDSTLRRLRVQRALQQGAKAQQEVEGVAASFAEIRVELVNNRVDTPERSERLQTQIVDPLRLIVAAQFPPWLDELTLLDPELEDPPRAIVRTRVVIQQTNELIFALQEVLDKMLELETFNELVDLVRSIIQDQEALKLQTEEERKRQARQLLED